MKNATDAKKLSDDEIALEVARLRRKILDLRTQTVTEKVADNSQFRKSRTEIARLLTEANARRKSRREVTA